MKVVLIDGQNLMVFYFDCVVVDYCVVLVVQDGQVWFIVIEEKILIYGFGDGFYVGVVLFGDCLVEWFGLVVFEFFVMLIGFVFDIEFGMIYVLVCMQDVLCFDLWFIVLFSVFVVLVIDFFVLVFSGFVEVGMRYLEM